VVNYVVKRDFDRESRKAKAPWCCTFKGFVRGMALQAARARLCSQMPRPTNWATPRFYSIFSKNFPKVVNYVVKRDFDRKSRKAKAQWCCTFKGFVRGTAL